MSKITKTNIIVDDMYKCKWLVDEVCCNDKSDWRADFPPYDCAEQDVCKYFEKEDGICE